MASRDEDISTNITSRVPTAPVDFSAMTLEEEALNGGWTRITHPIGEAMAAPLMVAGTRGDPDLDSDQTLAVDGPKIVSDEG